MGSPNFLNWLSKINSKKDWNKLKELEIGVQYLDKDIAASLDVISNTFTRTRSQGSFIINNNYQPYSLYMNDILMAAKLFFSLSVSLSEKRKEDGQIIVTSFIYALVFCLL
jgi:hypothetical protein